MPFDRPLPIAIAIQSFNPGGTERQMTELVRRLDRRQWEVHVACFSTSGAWFPRAAEAAASVGAFPLSGFARADTLTQARRFASWCRERQVALVHTTDLYTNIFFLPAASVAGVPVRIGSRREIAAGKSMAQVGLQRVAYSFAHKVIANAEAVAERLRRERVPARRIVVVPNGLERSGAGSRMSSGPVRHVTMVANLRPGKGHDTLIDAVPLVLERFPDARFSIVGDGTERAALEARAQSRGVAGAVSFVGHAEHVASHLAGADLFAFPSESEAFPNAVLEAMSAGLPVVATAVGGILEVVEHERTGLLVPPRDPHALASALCRVMADLNLARAMAAAGRLLVQTRYSFDRMVAAIDGVYREELVRRVPERAVQSQFASL